MDIKKIYCIQGFSSSGKDSLTNRVSKELNIPILISHTTRPPRKGEMDGETYYFVDNDYFINNESNFLEQRHYNTVNGLWRYGLHKSELINKDYALFIVDRQGFEELSEIIDEDKLISIFIEVSEDELRRRQLLRGDDILEFERRLEDDKKRFEGYLSDYVVYNDNFEKAIEKLKNIIIDEMED